ncbi:MAG TPA: FKBP-type peptidyl-prolyl cis-trans isomerase [Bacteroidia bacterium]|nr:FKBP-type peptidyl-prolyl cis-trans isomerase [Bacteroidia bacterium]HNS13593.1 FKBP-type peptidyl-prolyl cis-trans isomerase [Bacteroidia bacterium]
MVGDSRSICKNSVVLLSIITAVLFLGSSCKQKKQSLVVDENTLREKILEANQNILQAESFLIDSFIRAHDFNMQRTGSGLRYEIMREGNGKKASEGDEVMISYKAYLLDGSLCLSNPAKEPQLLKLGKGEQTKGVEETILLLSEGGSARMLVPAHLAYGPRGDNGNIPPASILYYELTLLAINK